MILKTINKEDFLNAIVYYPNLNSSEKKEKDWINLKEETSKFNQIYDIHHITVKNIAQYLTKIPKIENKLAKVIIELYEKFDINEFKSEPIETCPTLGDCAKSKLFLRGGNKRSIAYAMKLIKDECDFEPVKSSHLLYFTRLDDNNLAGLPTTKGEIKDC